MNLTAAREMVERLRGMGDKQQRHQYTIGDYWNAVDDAADLLRDLCAEVDKLNSPVILSEWQQQQAELDRLCAEVDGYRTDMASAQAANDRLRQRNAELRRLWFMDADPEETTFAEEFAAFNALREQGESE